VRVDTFLREDVTPEKVERWVQTASLLHSNGDGIDIAVVGKRSSVCAGAQPIA
jgi:hypothetical protein